MNNPLTADKNYFISGGCRSGKSSMALALAEHLAPSGLFIATAHACDTSMQERIKLHQKERSSHWQVFELALREGVTLVERLDTIASSLPSSQHAIVLDCLTLWVSNCMETITCPKAMQQSAQALVAKLYSLPNPIIIVSNEVGLGIVPSTPLGRQFRDFAGLSNQCAAKQATNVIFCVSGLPLVVKGALPTTFTV